MKNRFIHRATVEDGLGIGWCGGTQVFKCIRLQEFPTQSAVDTSSPFHQGHTITESSCVAILNKYDHDNLCPLCCPCGFSQATSCCVLLVYLEINIFEALSEHTPIPLFCEHLSFKLNSTWPVHVCGNEYLFIVYSNFSNLWWWFSDFYYFYCSNNWNKVYRKLFVY